jgi:DNA-binding beta-propeller fold protein YncE
LFRQHGDSDVLHTRDGLSFKNLYTWEVHAPRTVRSLNFLNMQKRVGQSMRRTHYPLSALLCFTLVSGLAGTRLNAADSQAAYVITKSIPLGAPDHWDYVTYESTTRRVYVAHQNSIAVVDGQSGAILGSVPVPGANGVAVIPSIGKGYAGSSTTNSVVVFDSSDFSVRKKLPADEDTDGVVYDPASKRVFVMEGDPQKLLVIDTGSDLVVARVALHGKPEFAAVDGAGKLYVNIADKREIQRIDTRTATVEATWSIAACESPRGLSIDPASHRLFSSCLNSKMLVVNAGDGRIVATLPIGFGSDAAAFDTKRKRAMSSNWDGTLSVFGVTGPDRYDSLGEVLTQPLARTMAVDSESGRVYLVAADRIEVDPSAANPRKRYGVRPGTVRLLFADPKP